MLIANLRVKEILAQNKLREQLDRVDPEGSSIRILHDIVQTPEGRNLLLDNLSLQIDVIPIVGDIKGALEGAWKLLHGNREVGTFLSALPLIGSARKSRQLFLATQAARRATKDAGAKITNLEVLKHVAIGLSIEKSAEKVGVTPFAIQGRRAKGYVDLGISTAEMGGNVNRGSTVKLRVLRALFVNGHLTVNDLPASAQTSKIPLSISSIQLNILKCRAFGMSLEEAEATTSISVDKIRKCQRKLLQQWGAKDMHEATIIALKRGILRIDDLSELNLHKAAETIPNMGGLSALDLNILKRAITSVPLTRSLEELSISAADFQRSRRKGLRVLGLTSRTPGSGVTIRCHVAAKALGMLASRNLITVADIGSHLDQFTAPLRPLTVRQLSVLRFKAAGLTGAEIASEMRLSPKSIAEITSGLMQNLKVRSSLDAVVRGIREGFISLGNLNGCKTLVKPLKLKPVSTLSKDFQRLARNVKALSPSEFEALFQLLNFSSQSTAADLGGISTQTVSETRTKMFRKLKIPARHGTNLFPTVYEMFRLAAKESTGDGSQVAEFVRQLRLKVSIESPG